MPNSPVFKLELTVSPSAIDENGHVNNVNFVQWMQDVAVQHYRSIGGVALTQTLDATWVVRRHQVEYFLPAFVGDVIEVRTWVANIRRVRSLRRYEFVRKSDGKMLVKGETDWVFVKADTGRPIAIPDEVISVLPLLPD